MAWWMAIPAAIQVAGSITNSIGQNSQAGMIRKQAAEQARRLRLQHDATLGETLARGAASGVESGSESLQTYLTQMTKEFRAQEEWIRKSASTEAIATENAALFGALSGVGSSIFSYGQANNWWRKA